MAEHTIAIHLANPTRINPPLSPDLSGRKAHDNASYEYGCQSSFHSIRRGPYHKKRGNQPIHNHTERDLHPNLPSPERFVQSLVAHFAKYRVHHHEQPHRFVNQLSPS